MILFRDYSKRLDFHSHIFDIECLFDPKKHRLHFDQVKVDYGNYTLDHCH